MYMIKLKICFGSMFHKMCLDFVKVGSVISCIFSLSFALCIKVPQTVYDILWKVKRACKNGISANKGCKLGNISIVNGRFQMGCNSETKSMFCSEAIPWQNIYGSVAGILEYEQLNMALHHNNFSCPIPPHPLVSPLFWCFYHDAI